MPARLVAVTDLPLVMDLFHSAEFIFGNRFDFRDRYSGEPGYFVLDGSKVRKAGTAAMFSEGEKGTGASWTPASCPTSRRSVSTKRGVAG